MERVDQLSKYANNLEGDVRQRYVSKCQDLGIKDPYNLPAALFKEITPTSLDVVAKELPDFTYPDLCTYLLHAQSYYTGAELKAYKSLEAYNQYIEGWLTPLQIWKVPGNRKETLFLIRSKVMHSQAVSKPPLQPWVVILDSGAVETAHCTCMAGLGEACTHIAATLFAMEAVIKCIKERTCTSMPCYWLGVPGHHVEFAEGSSIDFSSPAYKKCPQNAPKQPQATSREIPTPTVQENAAMYERLKATGIRSAILSIVPKYAAGFAPRSVALGLPDPLTKMYNAKWGKLDYDELSEICKEVYSKMKMTKEQATAIEEATKQQVKSKIWFQQRAGRITASKFKAACRTDPANPSVSLVKQICYPDSQRFSNDATRHGCEHESTARRCYEECMRKSHINCELTSSGLVLHPDYPFLGASPDGNVLCDCCGKGILEIKCPFCLKSKDTKAAASENKKFCLKPNADNQLCLDESHSYYYQVQLQLLLSGVDYCDFVIWRLADNGSHEIFVQRVMLDRKFMGKCVADARLFYIQGVLPELLGKWYSRPGVKAKAQGAGEMLPCYCKNSEKGGAVLTCQSGFCGIGDFHQSCVGLKTKPKRKWVCPDCRVVKKVKVVVEVDKF